MPMKNRIAKLLVNLKITPYRMAKDTGISANTVYALQKNPDQFPSGDVFDRLIGRYGVAPSDIVEHVSTEIDEANE